MSIRLKARLRTWWRWGKFILALVLTLSVFLFLLYSLVGLLYVNGLL